MDDPSMDPSVTPAAQTPQAEAQEILARALGMVPQGQGAGAQAPRTDPSPTAGGTAPAPLTGKVLVDWNGAAREVDIGELVKRDIERGNIEALRAAQQQELAELGGITAFAKQMASLNPEHRQALQAIMQNPALLNGGLPAANGHNGHAADDDALDLTRRSAPAAAQPADRDMPMLKEAIGFLLQREKEREQTVAQKSLEAEVTERLMSFSLFDPKRGALKGALEVAKGQALDHLIAHPDVKAEQAVAKIARDTQALYEQMGARQPGPLAAIGGVSQPGPSPSRIQLDPRKVGAEMESGKSAATAQALFSELLQSSHLRQ